MAGYEVLICSPSFRSGDQRDLIRCPSDLRCLTRLKNGLIRVEAWVGWWSVPEEYPGLLTGLANLETSSTGIRHLLDTPKNVPIRVEAWVSWWTTPAARSIVLDRSTFTVPVQFRFRTSSRIQPSGQVPGSSQADKFLVPAKRFQVRISVLRGSAVCHPPRSPVPVKTIWFQVRISVLFVGRRRFHPPRSPVPVKTIRFQVRVSVLRGSAVCYPPRSPDPVKAIQFPSRFRSCQGLPVQFLSSFRIHNESDHIDPTHQSSSSQGSVPVYFQFPDPSPFQIQLYESDPIGPTRFYFLLSVSGSSFQPGPRLNSTVGGLIPESRNPLIRQQQVPLRSSGRFFTDLP